MESTNYNTMENTIPSPNLVRQCSSSISSPTTSGCYKSGRCRHTVRRHIRSNPMMGKHRTPRPNITGCLPEWRSAGSGNGQFAWRTHNHPVNLQIRSPILPALHRVFPVYKVYRSAWRTYSPVKYTDGCTHLHHVYFQLHPSLPLEWKKTMWNMPLSPDSASGPLRSPSSFLPFS